MVSAKPLYFLSGPEPCALHGPRERPVILKLSLFTTMRGEHLRARVIERHEQPPVPLEDFACRVSEGQLMILNAFKRSKRDTAERDDDARIDNLYLSSQESGAVRDLRS